MGTEVRGAAKEPIEDFDAHLTERAATFDAARKGAIQYQSPRSCAEMLHYFVAIDLFEPFCDQRYRTSALPISPFVFNGRPRVGD